MNSFLVQAEKAMIAAHANKKYFLLMLFVLLVVVVHSIVEEIPLLNLEFSAFWFTQFVNSSVLCTDEGIFVPS